MTTNVRAFFIALTIIALALIGMVFAYELFRFTWSDESLGTFRRIIITICGVVPVAVVSLGFLNATIRDLFNLLKSDASEE